MGCCQVREKHPVPGRGRKNSKMPNSFSSTLYDEDDLICLPEHLAHCEESKAWNEIAYQIPVNSAIKNIGSLSHCFDIFIRNLPRYPLAIKKVLRMLLPNLLSLTSTNEEAFRKKCLKLIQIYLKYCTKKEISSLNYRQIYNTAIRYISCSDYETRNLAASICHMIFSKNFLGQLEFYKAKGISLFIQYIYLSTNDEDKLSKAIDYFYDLFIDDEGIVNPQVYFFMNEIDSYQVTVELRKIKGSSDLMSKISTFNSKLQDICLKREDN